MRDVTSIRELAAVDAGEMRLDAGGDHLLRECRGGPLP